MSDEPAKLVEVINPENHSFMQSMFIRIEQQGDEKIAHCALAYCIDSDKYSSWLIGKKAVGLEVGFTSGSFYIARNNHKLEMHIEPDRQTGYAMCLAVWQPMELSLTVLDKSYGEAIDSGADAIAEIEKRRMVLKTVPTFPPNSLITWCRKQAIVPIITYDSLPQFYQGVTFALQAIPDKARTASIYNAFWDITYKGTLEITPRKPKREPDIVSIIHGLLCDVAIAKNFQIPPQYPLGGGELDFLVSGQLKTMEITNVCVEFKHAHSRKLKSGLLKQLPAYMQTKGCDFGIYCVMFFKGKYFKKPEKYDLEGLDFYLKNLAGSAGLSNIRILVSDLSYPIPPSQL